MQYRGFEITSCPDSGIERFTDDGDRQFCEGYFCQIYLASDYDYSEELDYFCLAEGYEILDLSDDSLAKGIKSYVDGIISELTERKEKMERETPADKMAATVKESVKPIGMELTDFIVKVSDMVSSDDKTPVLDWVAFAGFMNEASEPGTSTLEKELLEVYRPLCYVKNNFSNAVLQQCLDMDTLGNEIIFGAMLFTAGYSEVDVRELANEGVLEDGFIPYGTDEKASLSIIGIQGRDDILFVEYYRDADSTRQRMKGAAVLAGVRGKDIETILTDEANTDRHMRKITHPKLIDAVKIACTASTAFEHITLYDPEQQEILQRKTEDMTTEQRVLFFCGGGNESEQSEDICPQM